MMLAARDNKLHVLEKLVELGQSIHHSANVSFDFSKIKQNEH